MCTLAAGAAIAIIAVAAPAVGVGADPQSACTATSGVTVVVDFTHFPGGEIERGCAAGQPANALDALHAAGFTTAGTAQYGDAFLCRIDGLPTPADEACAVTPSATAYWAFWHARPSDANWTYSATGVTNYQPAPGSIEAFAFGNHALPGVTPSGTKPTTSTTRGTVPHTEPPTTRHTGVSGATVPHSSTTTTRNAATSPSVSFPPGSAPSTPVSVAGSTTTSKLPPKSSSSSTLDHASKADARSAPRVIERVAGTGPHNSSGSPLPAVLTIVLVGSLALGAFVFSRARRRAAP